MTKKTALLMACIIHLSSTTQCSFDLNQFMMMGDDAFGGGFNDPMGGDASWGGGGFEDLFGGGNNESFDFGNSFDFGDGGDFGSLFGASTSDDKATTTANSTSGSEARKKEVTPPEAKSLKEAFEIGIKPEVTKLTTQYKDALKQHLGSISERLYTLQKYLASPALGAKYKRELGLIPTSINETTSLIDQLKNETVFHLTLYAKDFEKSRKRIIKLPATIDALISIYKELEDERDDSLKAKTSSKIISKQKKLFSSLKSLNEKELKPLFEDLKKIIDHKKTKEVLATKKKKYATRVGGSSAAAGGGWQSGAHNYFDDGARFGGYGGNSWGGGGDYWDTDFGYGNDFGYGGGSGGSYGNYSDWNSSSNWSNASSYPSSTSNSASTNTSAKNRTIYSTKTASSADNSDDFFDSEKNDSSHKTKNTGASANSAPLSELTPAEQRAQLLQSLPGHLNRWRSEYERAQGKTLKTAAIKGILAEPAFGTMAEQLALFYSLPETIHKTKTPQEEVFTTALNAAIPLLTHAACYANPALGSFLDEVATEKQANASSQAAKEKIRAQAYQRTRSYKALLAWLKAVREHKEEHPLIFKRIINELLGHAQTTLHALKEILKETRENNQQFSFDTTLTLATLSRQLFHEPIVTGYALLNEEEKDQKSSEKLKELSALKEAVEKELTPLIEAQYERVHSAIESAEKAMQEMSQTIDSESFATAFQGAVTAPDEVKALLIPYSKNRYRALETQHCLLQELMQFWSKKPISEEPEPHEDSDHTDPLAPQTSASSEDI